MSAADVRSILDIGAAAVASSSTKRIGHKPKRAARPDGISRELYALIGDNAPTAVPSERTVEYKNRRNDQRAVPWEKVYFQPGSSGTKAVLQHWARGGQDDERVGYFKAFDRQAPTVMWFSQVEYDRHLVDNQWSLKETQYLFSLLAKYDLRFVVVADRYDFQDNSNKTIKRTIEDIKDRYYTICRRLVRTRTATDNQMQQQLLQAYTFDKDREVKRKRYASELFHLTSAEIAEEEALFLEVKRMEQDERRFRSERDVLMRSVMGLDSDLVDLSQHNGEGVVGMDKKKRKRGEEEPVLPEVPEPPKPELHLDGRRCIHRTVLGENTQGRYPHVPAYLRSSKMPQPRAPTGIRVAELLLECGIGTQRGIMPTRENIDVYEKLIEAAANLIDMKRQVDRVEHDIRTLRAQGKGFIPPPMPKSTRSVSVASTDVSAPDRR